MTARVRKVYECQKILINLAGSPLDYEVLDLSTGIIKPLLHMSSSLEN